MKKLLTVLAIALSFTGMAGKGVHVKFKDGDPVGFHFDTKGDRLSFPWDGMYILQEGVSVTFPVTFDREAGDYVNLRDVGDRKYGYRVKAEDFYFCGGMVNAYILK